MTYLLDTHVFIWFCEGNRSRLGTTFVTRDRVLLRYAKRESMPVLDARK